jgi:hypothetical protein
MALQPLRTLLDLTEVLRPGLTAPSFSNFLVVFAGWIRTAGIHAVTEALVVTGVAGRRHHEAYHRFFSRGTWDPDELGRLLFDIILKLCEGSAIRVVVDDTLAPKKGPMVFGIGCHIDAVRSTRLHKVFTFGHVWVTVAVLLPVPFSSRTWALPILFRLYRSEKECTKRGHKHRKKTELAREALGVLQDWVGERRVEVAADCAYCCDTVTRGLPATFVFFGAMRPDAVLTSQPERKSRCGRPSKRGKLLPKPEKVAKNQRIPWQTCSAFLYGKETPVRYKTFCAQWYRACGSRWLRIVITECTSGAIPYRVFFCTDPTLTVVQILEGYGRRWAIEVCFRELKQLLGFADSSARKEEAVKRVAPFVGLTYTMLVLWFAMGAWHSPLACPPVRPWYRHKRGHSFADVLRAAQRALATHRVLDPRRNIHNLRQSRARTHQASVSPFARPRRAA